MVSGENLADTNTTKMGAEGVAQLLRRNITCLGSDSSKSKVVILIPSRPTFLIHPIPEVEPRALPWKWISMPVVRTMGGSTGRGPSHPVRWIRPSLIIPMRSHPPIRIIR